MIASVLRTRRRFYPEQSAAQSPSSGGLDGASTVHFGGAGATDAGESFRGSATRQPPARNEYRPGARSHFPLHEGGPWVAAGGAPSSHSHTTDAGKLFRDRNQKPGSPLWYPQGTLLAGRGRFRGQTLRQLVVRVCSRVRVVHDRGFLQLGGRTCGCPRPAGEDGPGALLTL
jgi:hypothetical protein